MTKNIQIQNNKTNYYMKKNIRILPLLLSLILFSAITNAGAQTTNVALGKAVTAQNTTEGSPANAVDGNLDSKWQSAPTFSQWIYVDLGAQYKINKIAVLFESGETVGWPTAYYAQVSDDATTWTTIDSIKANRKAATILPNLSGTGRYVRILLAGRAGAAGGKYYIIKELEVYGEPAKEK